MNLMYDYLGFTLSLFAMLDPFAAVPIFISLTSNFQRRERAATIRLMAITVFCVLVTSLFLGYKILAIFGASLDAFRIAGGIVLVSIAFSLLNTEISSIKLTEEENKEAENKSPEVKSHIGAVPLALPLLSGPGSISFVIVQAQNDPSIFHKISIVLGILTITLSILVIFRAAWKIQKFMGVTGINICNRIFGLLIAAVGVQQMAEGVLSLFPGLRG